MSYAQKMSEPELERMRWRCIKMLRGDFCISPKQKKAAIQFLSETKPENTPSPKTIKNIVEAVKEYGFQP